MSIITKTSAKNYFITGAFPTQSNFADTIDSYLGLGESGNQSIAGPLIFNGTTNVKASIVVSANTGLYGDITFGTSAASTARTSLGLGTAATLNVGVSANNVVQLNGSNQLPAVSGALLTNLPNSNTVRCYQVTSTSDLVLSTVPTQTNVGTTFSMNIPTKGRIEFEFSGEIINGATAQDVILGLRIGSTNYWPVWTEAGVTNYMNATSTNDAGTHTFSSWGVAEANSGTMDGSLVSGLFVEETGIPTGTQTVQVIAAQSGGTVTIKGNVRTTRVYITTYDHS